MTTYKIEGTTMRKILTNLLHDAGIAFEWDGEYLLLRDLIQNQIATTHAQLLIRQLANGKL